MIAAYQDNAGCVGEAEPDAPEPVPLLRASREAGPHTQRMLVYQHDPDRIAVTIEQSHGFGNYSTFRIVVTRATLDAWGELLWRASEDAARPEGDA
jgi:hypothetical protein